MHQQLLLAGADRYVTEGVTFNGTTNVLTHAGGLSGGGSSNVATISFWLKPSTSNGYIFSDRSDGANFNITFNSNRKINISLIVGPGGGATLHEQFTTTTALPLDEWSHVAISWNLSTSSLEVYINGIQDATPASYSNTSPAIDWSNSNGWSIGCLWGSGTNYYNLYSGDMAQLYINHAVYTDFSNSENLKKFFNNGKPVDLGESGEIPTGSSPLLFFERRKGQAANDFATNRGTEGSWVLNGSLTAVDGP